MTTGRYKNILLAFSLIASLAFSSCIRDATDVDVPPVEPKLVVYCFLSPQDENIRVWVSNSRPVYGTPTYSSWISTADVKLTDGATTVQLPFDATSQTNYKIDTTAFKIVAGRTYTLMVSTPDGKSAKATCTVPYMIDTTLVKYSWDTTRTEDLNIGEIRRTLKAEVEWQDPAGTQNYYRGGAQGIVYLLATPNTYEYQTMYNNVSGAGEWQTDKNNDGKRLALKNLETTVTEFVGGSTSGFSHRPAGIKIYVLNCEENYYKYHESAGRVSNGDPFSEAVVVHSNILGGLGCFGATNQYVKTIMF